MDYIVKDGEVIIVDEFTGRLMSAGATEGLHQAIEAKERVDVKDENQTLATITFQNYFRMYEKLSGMTGTASTEAEEFTHLQARHRRDSDEQADDPRGPPRRHLQDREREVQGRHRRDRGSARKGAAVLVGTTKSRSPRPVPHALESRGIPHEVLNAKYHEREAEIIAQAGRNGAVTIATNMAGRGTDIMLGGNAETLVDDLLRDRGIEPEEATDAQRTKHSPRRKRRAREEYEESSPPAAGSRDRAPRVAPDRQPAARPLGPPGDPGASQFYLSLEDDLMRRFAAATLDAP